MHYSLHITLPVLALLAVLLFFLPLFVSARVGVGMGAGEIRLDDPVKPGGIYHLPSLRVFNTGDEETTYDMRVMFHSNIPELRPGREWFAFNPAVFTLTSGQSQSVSITMAVPVKATPGDYFAYLESGPVASHEPGTSVGVAVATKLYFTIAPANVFQASLIRVQAFFNTHAPWSWAGLAAAVFIIVVAIVRRFFSFNIAVRER